MHKLFTLWMEKAFSGCFMTYPKDLFADLYSYHSKSFKLLKSDILAKYPEFSFNAEMDKGLFDLIQYDPTIEAIFYYRMERELFLANPQHVLLNYLASAMRIRTGMELYYSSNIGPGFIIMHGVGIIIGPRNTIGKNFLIYQGVTIGQRTSPQDVALIGDNVSVFAGAKIMGNVVIGDNVKIGANAVLLSNAEANSTYVGIPAKKCNQEV